MKKTNNGGVSRREIGRVDITAWAGVDDGGRAKVQGPVVEVNKKGPTAPNMKHISRVAWKRFTLTEEENPIAHVDGDRMVAYEKELEGKQKDMDGNHEGAVGEPNSYETNEPSGSSYSEPQDYKHGGNINNPLTWAKNMLDNHDNHIRTLYVLIAVLALAIGAVGIISALLFGKVF